MNRIYHHWEKWECYKAGFYDGIPPDDMEADDARKAYAVFLADGGRFRAALQRVGSEWPTSCEQFLTNENINRIAWLGQSSMCIETGIPSCFRGGFWLLSREEQKEANRIADEFLQEWLRQHEESPCDSETVRAELEEMRLF